MTTGRAKCTAFLGAVAIAVCASAAPAQQRALRTSSDSVPRLLAEAIIEPQFVILGMLGVTVHRQPGIIVGRLPAVLSGHLWVPPGARVLGGVELDSFATAIIESHLGPDSLRAAYRRAQPGLGWMLPPSRDVEIGPRGFVPADVAGNDDPAAGTLSFCSKSSTLGISIDTVGGIPIVRAVVLPIRADICLPHAAKASASFAFPEHPMLRNPPGSGDGYGRTCDGFNSSGGGGNTTLVSPMSIDEVLADYGRQLTSAGWAHTNGETRGQTWSRTDSGGTYMEVTLTAQRRAQAPQCLNVRMEMSSRRP